MEFKDLPIAIQEKAAETLAASLKEHWGELKSEPAKELARNIKAAFVELNGYSHEESNGEIQRAIANGVAQSVMETNSPRAKAWLKIISAARSSFLALEKEYQKDTENASINSILEAFGELGRIPPFPDMRYSLMSEGGYYDDSGKMVIISPKEECASWLIKAVICQPV